MSNTHFIIDTTNNIVVNHIVWDGVETWYPPEGHITVPVDTVKVKNWIFDSNTKVYVLQDSIGGGGIGYKWDGEYLITPIPQPTIIAANNQPQSIGTQTI